MLWGVLLLAVGSTSGCETINEALASLERPNASVQQAHLTSLDLDAATVEFDLDVRNPYSVALPVLNLQYRLFHADELFVEGSTDDDVIIAARGRQTIPLRVTVPFAGVLRAVEDIRPGEVLPYRAELGLTVDTPATSGELLLADHQGELPIPAAPDIEVRSLAWESLTLNSARAAMTLDITNTNSFPVGVQTLQGGLTLAGMRVADLRVAEAVSLEPGAQAELKIPVSFSPLRFGAAFFRSLTGSDDMSYALDGTLDVRTPWGEHLWPLLATGEADFE